MRRRGIRTSYTDLKDAGQPTEQLTTVAYCYDNADRLLSTSGTGADPLASPITDGLAAADIVYDAHGNTTKLADQSITYDVADQHTPTTVGSEVVSYTPGMCPAASSPATPPPTRSPTPPSATRPARC